MEFSAASCKGTITIQNNNVYVKGNILESVKDHTLSFIAACPPDFRSSFSGSGLPYANPIMAMDNTPNKGELELGTHNYFDFVIQMPGSYYTSLGTELVPPTVYLRYNNGMTDVIISVKISDSIPYRLLTYPSTQTAPRTDAMFYKGMYELPIRTQEQILRDSAYPSKWNNNFWGQKPPM